MAEGEPLDAVPAPSTPGSLNRFSVDVRRDGTGWSAEIVDPDGKAVGVRSCANETEARIYASTVRQHAEWLSEERFREYYGFGGDG